MQAGTDLKNVPLEGFSPPQGAPRATVGGEDPKTPRGVVNPEVSDRPVRRKFTAPYKLSILRQADNCTEHGQLGALLRREGIYSSTLRQWREQRERAALAGLAGKKRGRKGHPLDARTKKLLKENARLHKRLERAELIIEFQKKASEILGIPLKGPKGQDSD